MTTKEQMAARLNGRECGFEMTAQDVSDARAAGLVVVFGASDDLIEFRGAIHEEEGCFEGGVFYVTSDGHVARDGFVPLYATPIRARWASEPGYSWTYATPVSHATFEVVEDGEPYCRGIVFALADLAKEPCS